MLLVKMKVRSVSGATLVILVTILSAPALTSDTSFAIKILGSLGSNGDGYYRLDYRSVK